jgi:hypothetical protein
VSENKKVLDDCRRTYKEILLSHSLARYNKKFCYIKHFRDIDLSLFQENTDEYIIEAQEKGLETEEEKLILLCKGGHWSWENEDKIKKSKEEIDHLRKTKSKLFIQSQIKEIDKEIKEEAKKLTKISLERVQVVGVTAEKLAEKRSNETLIFYSLFADRELEKEFFSKEEYDELHQDEIYKLMEIYNVSCQKFAYDKLQLIAACSFFMSSYGLCADNPYTFFGKPVVNMSVYQTNLFSLGKHYKSILSQGKVPPEEYVNDPEKMVSWYDGVLNADKLESKATNTEGRSFVGASKDEMESTMTEAKGAINLNKEVAKRGGKVTFDEILKLHGHK